MVLINYIIGVITTGLLAWQNASDPFVIGFAIIWGAYMICDTIKDKNK